MSGSCTTRGFSAAPRSRQATMAMLAADAGAASISATDGRRSRELYERELYETVQNLELSVRLAPASYQPVDTIADRDERKSRASDRSWSAMDATTCPIGGAEGRRRSVIEHMASSCDT
jgi:hypothetical protein